MKYTVQSIKDKAPGTKNEILRIKNYVLISAFAERKNKYSVQTKKYLDFCGGLQVIDACKYPTSAIWFRHCGQITFLSWYSVLTTLYSFKLSPKGRSWRQSHTGRGSQRSPLPMSSAMRKIRAETMSWMFSRVILVRRRLPRRAPIKAASTVGMRIPRYSGSYQSVPLLR